MRKLLTTLLISLLLMSAVSPVFASGYRDTAMDYLTEKYGVASERIEMYEGGIMELEFTKDSFWCAKYIILGEGKTATGTLGGSEPMPKPEPTSAPEPMPMPKTDVAPETKPAIMPLPPEDVYKDDSIYGAVYIRVKTGEILEAEAMQPYFDAEATLAQQEWDRLRKEAGKLDVSLYRKLLGLAATDTVKVWIQPAPVITDSLRAQFAALKAEYPEFMNGMELEGILQYGYGYILPVDIGVTSEAAGSGSIGSGNTGVVGVSTPGYAVPPTEVKPVPPPDAVDANVIPVKSDEEYRLKYTAFSEALEQIRVQAVTPALEDIKTYLTNIGANCQVSGTSISTELTVTQIKGLANMKNIATVWEDYGYGVAEDGKEILIAPGNATSGKTASLPPAGPEPTGAVKTATTNDAVSHIQTAGIPVAAGTAERDNASNTQPVFLAFGGILVLALAAFSRRIVHIH